MRRISILGSTGSIGVQALELIANKSDEFEVVALAAGGSHFELLIQQAKAFNVSTISIARDASEEEIQAARSIGATLIHGSHASSEIASIPVDICLNGITGSIGLAPTLAALEAGNLVALANKESLVAGGDLVMRYGRDKLIPVDSEHSALYQAMKSGREGEISRLVLTASGGPFRSRENLDGITVEQALAHPTWNMGPVVTINSATLANKGLEIIEAHYLFDFPYNKIEAVIHPQSMIHSMVEFYDGSTIAQASPPDMKLPIGYALNGGEHLIGSARTIDWGLNHNWSFSPIDHQKFPSVELAKAAGEIGGGATTIFNAVNEVAVDAFIRGIIEFKAIIPTVEKVMNAMKVFDGASYLIRDLGDVSALEQDSRIRGRELVK
jgi:1-deoxy-D-xylulose-5-phosphate reductoisomerase